MHKVVVDRSHLVVSVTVAGYLDDAAVQAAAVDLHAAIRSLGAKAGRHVTLYDMTGLQAVSPTTLARFAGYFVDPKIASLWARRVAMVSVSPLVTLQMERVSRVRDTLRVFSNRREAMAWLLADEDRLRPAA